MIRDAQEIKSLALKYSKPQLAHMAQIGLIDTQKAVLAAMMRDRIAKEDAKPPTTTVAQDVMGIQPQMAQIAPTSPEQPMGMPAAPAVEAPAQMAATGGLTSIPYKEQDYAGGGIVAFADGGDTGYEYKFNPDTGEYTLVGEKKKEVPVDTRQHLGAAGLGVFGSEGMDLMTGLPKGNMRDPVLGFASGGVAHYLDGGITNADDMFTPVNPMSYGEQMSNAFGAIASAPFELIRRIVSDPSLSEDQKKAEVARVKAAQAAETQSPAETARLTRQNAAPVSTFAAPTAEKQPPLPKIGAPKMPAAPALPPIGQVPEAKVTPYKMPEVESIQTALGRQEEADKAAGVDTGIYEKLRGEFEGKKGKLGERKQEAIGMAIMQTGLGLMGASKGRELAALGESGQKALAGLVASNEKIRDYEDKLEDKQRELYLAENDYKRTKSKSALDRVQRIEDKRSELEVKTVDAQNRAAEHRETILATTRGQDITAQGQKLQYQAHMAQIGAMYRPTEVERAQATYADLYKKDPAAAAKWLETRTAIMGAGRSGKSAADYMEQYADDWNKLDIIAKGEMKKQGITNEQQYINYRMQQHGRFATGNPMPVGGNLTGTVDTSNPLLK